MYTIRILYVYIYINFIKVKLQHQWVHPQAHSMHSATAQGLRVINSADPWFVCATIVYGIAWTVAHTLH